ncbi:GAF domain-containing protein [Patulibacter sp. NPDC049589]|uniref:GAF domain-containing protein n=1 Tax=Patulibacter sp. NPDC049589 TaxID=3154731 RepID=UPI0034438232
MPRPVPVLRAPMRARDRDAPTGAGAAFGIAHGLVGTGDALDAPPATIDEAVAAAADRHGDKAGRMLRRFADLPDGVLVWTREADGALRLGRITGPWRYDDSPAAREVGIHHVRPTTWLPAPTPDEDVPAAVLATFDRGGRNLQRTHDEDAERRSAALWAAHAPAG